MQSKREDFLHTSHTNNTLPFLLKITMSGTDNFFINDVSDRNFSQGFLGARSKATTVLASVAGLHQSASASVGHLKPVVVPCTAWMGGVLEG